VRVRESDLEAPMVKGLKAVSPSLLGKLGTPLGRSELIVRFNRLAWSAPTANHAKGVIAAGMETGEVHVYDPEKIMAGKR
jgi:hypothetical protein